MNKKPSQSIKEIITELLRSSNFEINQIASNEAIRIIVKYLDEEWESKQEEDKYLKLHLELINKRLNETN